MARIFINFRNFDGDWAALAIRNTLVERFDANEIFLSSFSIQPGADFAAELLSRAAECDVLLAVIGPHWLTVTGPDGMPRLGAPDDWVCREIETAFANGRTVVPIMLSGADRPREADLPPRIARLAGMQGCRLDRPRYTTDMGALGDALAELIPGLMPKETATGAPGWTIRMRLGEVTDQAKVVGISTPSASHLTGLPDIDLGMDVNRVSGEGRMEFFELRDEPAKPAELSPSRCFLFPVPFPEVIEEVRGYELGGVP